MARVCMFLMTPLAHDARVEKEASSLARAGHSVRVVALAGGGLPSEETRDGWSIARVDAESAIARLARWAIARRAGRGSTGGAPGTVIRLGAGDRPGPRARTGEALKRAALRTHLALHRRAYARAALREAAAAGADVWLAHDLDALATGVAAKRALGGRLVYDSHELYVDRSDALETPLTRRLWMRHEARLIRHADRVFTVNESIADVLARRYRVPRPGVLRNVPPYAPPPDAAADRLRRAAGIEPDAPVALYLGGLGPGRGVETLVPAVAELASFHLVLLGPARAGFAAELEALARDHGIERRVHVLPAVAVEEVRAWAASADVGLVPYPDTCLNHRLSLPTKLFDYLSAGVPVAASDLPELRRVVERYGVGEVFDADDPASIAAAVRAVAADPERRARLRDNAVAAARELTWESESEPLLAAVAELAR